MSISETIVAPERRLSADSVGYSVGESEAAIFAPESELDASEPQAEETGETNRLPLTMFLAGLGIYFVSIAALASFAGVAVGVFVMVVGAIVCACRGLGMEAGEYQTDDGASHLAVGEVHVRAYDRSIGPDHVLVTEYPEMPTRTTGDTVPVMNDDADAEAVYTPV
jgi:hypothetical protein